MRLFKPGNEDREYQAEEMLEEKSNIGTSNVASHEPAASQPRSVARQQQKSTMRNQPPWQQHCARFAIDTSPRTPLEMAALRGVK